MESAGLFVIAEVFGVESELELLPFNTGKLKIGKEACSTNATWFFNLSGIPFFVTSVSNHRGALFWPPHRCNHNLQGTPLQKPLAGQC
jgi:hypothetical protein